MRSLIVRLTLADGSVGLGECPTSAAFGGETIPAMSARLAGWRRRLAGVPVGEWEAAVASLRRDHPDFPMAVSGLETALFRASLAARGLPEHSYWGGKLATIETDITVPFIPGHPALPRWLGYAVKKGFKVYKIKVSGEPSADREFLSSVYGTLGERVPGFVVRIDGNQGYGVKTFLDMTDFLERKGYRVELFEQPLPRDDYRGLREAAKRSAVPVVLDETVVTGDDAMRAADRGLGHGINIKVAKSGIGESSRIMAVAREAGLSLMIGCMTETMVGLSAGIFLAAGSGGFDYVDLDGIHFLHHRRRYGSVGIDGPRFTVR